jgi:hypothetical protein
LWAAGWVFVSRFDVAVVMISPGALVTSGAQNVENHVAGSKSIGALNRDCAPGDESLYPADLLASVLHG